MNFWACTIWFRSVHALLKLLKVHHSWHLNLCLEFSNDLKTTNKYLITYRDALVYIMAKILMRTFDCTKIADGPKCTLFSMGSVNVER